MTVEEKGGLQTFNAGNGLQTIEEMEALPVEAWVAQKEADRDIFRMILDFLGVSGHVLLIQGAPGTGKTTLALEILRQTRSRHRVYCSSRTSPTKLRQHFPWIDEVLDSMSGRVAKADRMSDFQDLRGPEADNVFNKVLRLKHSSEGSLMVVDSWEGAVRNTTEEGRGMLETAILSELEESRLSVALVTEGGKSGDLGHLVDGIVTLSAGETDGRVSRLLTINKLRGFRVPINRWLFSLNDGRFTLLPPANFSNGVISSPKPMVSVPHPDGFYSTGSRDLDALLGGGFAKGSFVLIEVDNNTPPSGLSILLNVIGANTINQGGACFLVPLGSFSADYTAEGLKRYIGSEALDERVRIVDFNPESIPRKWRVSLKGKLSQDVAKFMASYNELNATSPYKILMMDYDKIQQMYGDDLALPGFTELGASMRDSGVLNIGTACRPTKVREEFVRTADYHLKIRSVEGSFLIYGVKPYTPMCGVKFDVGKGYPGVKLVPMV